MRLKSIFIPLTLAAVLASCVYHNDDNPNIYPDPEPIPQPKPEPEPDINEEYVKAAYSPNCYMVRPGTSVVIPVLKGYAMWSLYSGWLGASDLEDSVPEPVLLWQDIPGLITSVGLTEGSSAKSSSMIVSTSDKIGNAVVGVRIKGGIRWSWHIWVTRYDPDSEQVAYGKTYSWDNNSDGVEDYIFMDRNLGAVNDGWVIGSETADSLAACGLMYQWGRKDPFPGDSGFRHSNSTDYEYFASRPIYDSAGNLLTEGSQSGGTGIRSVHSGDDPSTSGLAKSVLRPMEFILGESSFQDWFCGKEPVEISKCDTLWCGESGRKTPFDPCPEGWQVPSDKNGLFVWNGLSEATTEYSPLGVIPYNGLRYRNGGGCLKNSGFAANIWSGTPPSKIGNAYQLSIYLTPSDKKPTIRRDVAPRSDGYAVRCAKSTNNQIQ